MFITLFVFYFSQGLFQFFAGGNEVAVLVKNRKDFSKSSSFTIR